MPKHFIFCLLFVVVFLSTKSQQINLVKTDIWKGFERIHFMIAGHEAYFVKPSKSLADNPWIWRASFPDWHTEMDSLLLSKGMYVAFVNVDNQYGSPYAMQVWDKFYHLLVDSFSFAKKVSLEAVSRGGLYAYGWAKRNPDLVNCIYAEGPVCDFKSWPGGKGKGIGDSTSWKELLNVYGFNEQQAMAYNDNPIDHLEGLAAFKVPLIHVIGNQDKVVPSDENSYPLLQRYTALGGPVIIYPVTAGPQELFGHHYPIEHAEWWAEIILKKSFPVKPQLPYENYFKIRGGLQNAYKALTKNKKATVAFLGGSITYMPGWRDKVCSYLKENFPATDFHFINAGIPSLGSLPHAFRLQNDLLNLGKIDLLFVEAAVNDRANGTDSLTQIRALEGIVRHAKNTHPLMDIVLMSFADPDKNKDYDKGNIPVEVINHETVANYYQLPSINLAKEIHDKVANNEFSWEYDFKDLHPSPLGQELYFATIKKMLADCFKNNVTATANKPGVGTLPRPLNKANFDRGKYALLQHAVYDSGWHLINDWKPTDGFATREGFVHVPVLESTQPGSKLHFGFSGTAVGIAVVSGADAGSISYSIDNGPFKNANLYTQWSSYLHLPWYIVLAADLKRGKHFLTLKINEKASGNKGTACRIVHFLVNE